MDTNDIFRKLIKGTNIVFDHKRFKDDFAKLGLLNTSGKSLKIEEETKYDTEECTETIIKDDIDESVQNESLKSVKLSQRKLHRIKKDNNIHTWGSDITEIIEDFGKLESYGVSKQVVSNLQSQGYSTPTPIQMQGWPLMLKGREVMACAPTGSGKTLCFLLPIIHHLKGPRKKGFRAVIVSPTRELAKQTARECRRLIEGTGLRTYYVSSVKRAMEKYGPGSAKHCDIMIATPIRLIWLIQNKSISLENVQWLIIDESDRLFEAGLKGFREQLAIIYKSCSNHSLVRGMFSATYTSEVEEWCKMNLNNVAMVTIGSRNISCEDVKQELLFCGDETGKIVALKNIIHEGYEPPVLIFVQTKERAKQLFRELIFENLMVEAIHADRTEMQRDNVIKAFRERRIWILICTELLARGIDFKGVNLVINFDFPPTTISYVHRVGRTGRAGHKGRAITFWTMEDKPLVKNVANLIKSSGSEVPNWILDLKKASKRTKVAHERKHLHQGFVSDTYKHEQYLQKKEQVRKWKELRVQKKAKKAEQQQQQQQQQPSTENTQLILKPKRKRKQNKTKVPAEEERDLKINTTNGELKDKSVNNKLKDSNRGGNKKIKNNIRNEESTTISLINQKRNSKQIKRLKSKLMKRDKNTAKG